MVEYLKELLAPLLKIDLTAPHIPAGHEKDKYLKAVRASKRFLTMRYTLLSLYGVAWFIGIVLGTIVLLFSPIPLWWISPLVAVFIGSKVLLMYITTRIDYDLRWYLITDTTLRVRYGVFSIREITVSFGNVQNVRIVQGPVERLFDISTLIVDTAGGGNADRDPHIKAHRAVMRGIENPKEVRDMILSVLKMNKHSGLGDPDDEIMAMKGDKDINTELRMIAQETGKLKQLFTQTISS